MRLYYSTVQLLYKPSKRIQISKDKQTSWQNNPCFRKSHTFILHMRKYSRKFWIFPLCISSFACKIKVQDFPRNFFQSLFYFHTYSWANHCRFIELIQPYNTNICNRSFQKKFKQLLQPWRLNYMILALNESMKIFFGQIHSFSLFHWTCLASLRPSRYAS